MTKAETKAELARIFIEQDARLAEAARWQKCLSKMRREIQERLERAEHGECEDEFDF